MKANTPNFAALERYAPYTDMQALQDYSARPLRKCIRVNTLKTDVETVVEWGRERGWKLEAVPWCPEGFFVDRENREEPLGKDPLHLFGHMYMQEASSMLPVELLQPEPGHYVLDMAAAPGSKTTQIAAKLQGRGVVVANDMQEKRLWTLKSAVYRAGATNVLITKKMGQWFGRHMTERFDRVLCDAPCTAQGTIRKDPTALQYCSELSIMKAAKLQRELLEAAVHACKVGGRIVYSTCTLTPEENEEVVAALLKKMPDSLRIVLPEEIEMNNWSREKAIEASAAVQAKYDFADKQYPMYRVWPQTYDSEGFFCAVLQKTAPTMDVTHMDIRQWYEQPVKPADAADYAKFLEKRYGTPFMQEHEVLYSNDKELFLLTREASRFFVPTIPFSIGIPFGKLAKSPPVLLHHALATLRGANAIQNTYTVTDEDLQKLLQGDNIACDEACEDHTLLQYTHLCVGIGRAKKGQLKNHIPRTIVTP